MSCFHICSVNYNSPVSISFLAQKVYISWNCQGNVREFCCVWRVVTLHSANCKNDVIQ